MNESIALLKKNLEGIEANIKEAEEAIDIMSEAGENVTSLKANLQTLKTRQKKWIKALEAHGY